jgi:hypothetical protein
MHVFLFDEDHPELRKQGDATPCAQVVVAALEHLDPVPTTQLIRGAVIVYADAYR